MLTLDQIYLWLEEVKDPEIPVISLVDLGVINEVRILDNSVMIEMTPTFVGCPALDMMKQEVIELLQKKGVADVQIEISFSQPWTTDRISERGRAALKKFGLAPPPRMELIENLDILEYASCPRCSGVNTELRSTFGSTLCRSIHYCFDCKEAFEQFKPLWI